MTSPGDPPNVYSQFRRTVYGVSLVDGIEYVIAANVDSVLAEKLLVAAATAGFVNLRIELANDI
jgi:hypothetical protein